MVISGMYAVPQTQWMQVDPATAQDSDRLRLQDVSFK